MEPAVEHLSVDTLPAIPFRRVLPDDLGAEWRYVESGLVSAVAKCGLAPYTGDELLQSLVDERTALYRHEHGFMVLAQCVDAVTGAKVLNVCLAWFAPGEGVRARHEAVAWLDAMKLAHGCVRIEYSSPREGWVILAPDFTPAMTVWVRA